MRLISVGEEETEIQKTKEKHFMSESERSLTRFCFGGQFVRWTCFGH